MDVNLTIVTAPFCIFMLLLSLELIRRRHLKEKYALLWLFSSLIMLVLCIFNKVIMDLAPRMGLNPITLVVIVAFFFLILICINFSLSLSRLSEDNKILNQEYALLAQRVEALERKRKVEPSSWMGA